MKITGFSESIIENNFMRLDIMLVWASLRRAFYSVSGPVEKKQEFAPI
jgi:hypothetical protein